MTAEQFGQGTTIAYNAAAGSYTFTARNGETVTMAAADRDAAITTNPNYAWKKVVGTKTHSISIGTPQTKAGVLLTHTRVAAWNIFNTSGNSNWTQFQVFGIPTTDMPTSGTASYDIDGQIGATGFESLTGWDFQPNSTGTFSVNFGSGSISTLLNLIGLDRTRNTTKDFGSFNGSGAITSGSSAFGGTFGSQGQFQGSFFGPQAREMAYAFFIDGPALDVTGTVTGVKK